MIIMLVVAFLAGIVLFVVALRVVREFKKEQHLAARRKTTSLHIARVVSAVVAADKRDEAAPGVSVITKAAEDSPAEPDGGSPDEDTADEPAYESAGEPADESVEEPADGSVEEPAGGEQSDDEPGVKPESPVGAPVAKPSEAARQEADGASEESPDDETRETQAVSMADVAASVDNEDAAPAAAPPPQPAPIHSMHMQPIQPLRTLQPVEEQDDDRPRIAGVSKKRRLPETVKMKERRVLLVEDVKVHRELIEMYFEGSGVKFDFAENGVVACDMFLSNPDGYSLILMDIKMPVMNGYDAARKIRGLDVDWAKQIPIIAITADATEDDIGKCFEAGMDDHIVKPIDMDALQEKVFEFITRDTE